MPDVRRTVTQKMNWMDLQVGDLISDNGIQFVVISREGNQAIIQQYDQIENHVFNEDGSNEYKGSDLEKYVQGEYKKKFSAEFLQRCGDFFILPEEMYEENEYLKDPKNRIRYDSEGHSTWYWTSSPNVGYANGVRYINPTGNVIGNYAYNGYGVAPACVLNLGICESAPTGAPEADSNTALLTEIRDLLVEITKAVY